MNTVSPSKLGSARVFQTMNDTQQQENSNATSDPNRLKLAAPESENKFCKNGFIHPSLQSFSRNAESLSSQRAVAAVSSPPVFLIVQRRRSGQRRYRSGDSAPRTD